MTNPFPRTWLALAGLLAVPFAAACSSAKPSSARSMRSDAVPVEPVSSADAPRASSTSDSASDEGSSASKDSVLFNYKQGSESAAFASPNVVLFRRATYGPPSCRTKLSSDANMWTGSDVEEAFRAPEVAAALKSATTYWVKGAKAKLTAPGYPGSISWVSRCSDCPEEPSEVKHLREVMQTVISNRSAVCP